MKYEWKIATRDDRDTFAEKHNIVQVYISDLGE